MIAENQIIRLKSPDGSEEVIEIPGELWEKFAAKAKEMGMSEEELFHAALDNFLKKQGY